MLRPYVRSLVARAATESANGSTSETAAKPVVKIDNSSDPFASIITITFGDKLGDLLDTMAALKNLGLNIQRANLASPTEDDPAQKNRFYVTEAESDEKVTKSARLEEIRLTILNTMMTYHPEAGESLSLGTGRRYMPAMRDQTHPLGAAAGNAIETSIDMANSRRHTIMRIRTADRPGLLVDIVHILKDISVNVLSAEIDTVGAEADDRLLISYHGEPLNSSMQMLAQNALQYYLSLAEVAKDESY
mmetsp:Transcript_17034/g.42793  ORF Transcript_17034/g.42793 Transcript_17034/m.42793 type:complete len:247 (+) Transcript_17034:6-746(+)